jgi:hypothetical protein
MKKSKIIAPAAAILVFSSAAAVTGTVAWFTANRVATVGMTSITAVNPEAGLTYKLTNLAGTTPSGAASTQFAETGSVAHENLRDASVDLTAETIAVWRSIITGSEQPATFEAVTDDAAHLKGGTIGSGESAKDYYYATKFSIEFKLSDTSNNKNYELFYDNSGSTFTHNSAKAAKGLRIGIVVGNNRWVIAPFQTESPLSHVATASSTANFENAKCFVDGSSQENNLATATASTISNDAAKLLKGYLGTLNTTNVTATVYTWIEGTDAATINENVDGVAMASSLKFRMIEQAA